MTKTNHTLEQLIAAFDVVDEVYNVLTDFMTEKYPSDVIVELIAPTATTAGCFNVRYTYSCMGHPYNDSIEIPLEAVTGDLTPEQFHAKLKADELARTERLREEARAERRAQELLTLASLKAKYER